jgi:hypothetical protein
VNEDIFAAVVRRDESKTFTCVEELNFARLHILSPVRNPKARLAQIFTRLFQKVKS